VALQIVVRVGVMLKAIIVDDEPLAHQVLLHHLKSYPDISVVKQCYDATRAMAFLAGETVDLMFLDINMPQLSGIELLRVLANRPQVVLISAYQEYALEGFELDVTDYLLKPVSPDRFTKAIGKVLTRHQASTQDVQPVDKKVPEPLFVNLKVDRGVQRFSVTNIVLCEAYGNYVKLREEQSMTLVSSTLKAIASQLPVTQFVKVHKSYLVNKKFVKSVQTDTVVLTTGQTVRIGKSFKKSAQALLQ
jgi:DNA-binding LytR/AlgR family response regulator